jgi:hypothetical protein
LIQRWLASLAQIPSVDVVWLEGSLAGGRANPASDIDLRMAIADAAYQQLWETDRRPLLEGLGEYLLLEARFVRALTAEGIIVELWAYRTSELPGCAPYEWETLLCRLPGDELPFGQGPHRTAAEVWPDTQELTVDEVRSLMHLFLLLLAQAPSPLYSGELHSARFQLDDVRTELVKLMYRQLRIKYPTRYKHFSEVLRPPFLADLERTYMRAGAAPFDSDAMAEAYIALFEVLGMHLQALSDQAGGGFEPAWYWRLHQQITSKLTTFGSRADQTDD